MGESGNGAYDYFNSWKNWRLSYHQTPIAPQFLTHLEETKSPFFEETKANS
jgi:hypothetical protein